MESMFFSSQEVSNKLKDTLKVVKIDTDKYPKIASRYQIQVGPSFFPVMHVL